MTLEQVFQFVEAKEAGKRSASKLIDYQGADSASSPCRRNKNMSRMKNAKPKPETLEICSYCGKTIHGVRAPPHIRLKECAAYGQTCSMCSLRNHLPSMCRSSDKSPLTRKTQRIMNALFSIHFV